MTHPIIRHGWDITVYGGSTVAMGIGSLTALFAEHEPATAVGIITALAGLVAALTALVGGHVVPILRIWLSNLHTERQLKYQQALAEIARQDMAGKLAEAQEQILINSNRVTELAEHAERVAAELEAERARAQVLHNNLYRFVTRRLAARGDITVAPDAGHDHDHGHDPLDPPSGLFIATHGDSVTIIPIPDDPEPDIPPPQDPTPP